MICIKLPALTFATLLSVVLAVFPLAQAQTGPQPRLRTIDLTAGIHVIKTELAITPEQQQTGMMFRREMGTSEGMLFVNDEPGQRCFWMRSEERRVGKECA